MIWEFHPEFQFDSWGGGYLPIRLKLKSNGSDHYPEDGVITGFEIDFDEYDYQQQLDEIENARRPKAVSFIGRLFGKQASPTPVGAYVASKDIDDSLRKCRKQ